jgi:hypothetical protein
MSNRIAKTLAAAATLAVALAACSSGTSGGGDTSQVGKPATISHIHGLGVDSSGTLHVATHFGLIKESAGAWVYASADKNDHMGFSLDPKTGTMYRSGHSASRPSLGVERSSDGARWEHLSDVLSPPVDFHAMTVSFVDGKTLYGWDSGGRGVFRSDNGGESWTKLPQNLSPFVLAAPATRGLVFAATGAGLLRSDDQGMTWKPVAALAGGYVAGLAVDPQNADHLLAFTERGLKRTSDGGKTWTDGGGGIARGAGITSLAISAADSNVAYAADQARIWKTSDGGASWQQIHPA